MCSGYLLQPACAMPLLFYHPAPALQGMHSAYRHHSACQLQALQDMHSAYRQSSACQLQAPCGFAREHTTRMAKAEQEVTVGADGGGGIIMGLVRRGQTTGLASVLCSRVCLLSVGGTSG